MGVEKCWRIPFAKWQPFRASLVFLDAIALPLLYWLLATIIFANDTINALVAYYFVDSFIEDFTRYLFLGY